MGVQGEVVGDGELRVRLRSGGGEGRRPDEVILVVVPVAVHGRCSVGEEGEPRRQRVDVMRGGGDE